MGRYRGVAVEVQPLGGGRALLLRTNPCDGRPQSTISSAAAAAAVDQARDFRPLDAHADAHGLRHDGDPQARTSLLAELQRLASEGFLLERGALQRPTPDDTPTSITTLAIPSGGRPTLALDTLRGYLANIDRAFRRIEVVLVDTSTDPADRVAYQRGLLALARQTAAPLRYIGAAQVEAHAERLATTGLDPALLRFACADPLSTGQAYGAARNRILLDTVGSAVLSVDDDVRCSVAPCPAPEDGIALYTGDGPGYHNYDPHQYWFFDDRAQVLASQESRPADLLAIHERFLGREVRSVLAEHPADALDTTQLLDPSRLESIAAGRARLPITFFGLRGDAGMYAPTWHLLMTGASRARLHRSHQAYERAITSRELLRCVTRPTLSDGRWYQGTMIGLDNREALPPTLPVMRYEDGVFRIVVHRTRPHAMCAYLPWTVLHDRPGATPWVRDRVWQTGGWTRTGEMVVRLLLHAQHTSRDPTERLRTLGRHLVALARLPIGDFFECVALETLRQKARYIRHFEHLLEHYNGEPAWWARDVQRHLAQLERSLQTPEFFVPLELRERMPLHEAQQLARDVVGRYGQLLIAWPEMVAATRAGPRLSILASALA